MKIRKILQEEIAAHVIYESRHGEDVLKKRLLSLERRLAKEVRGIRSAVADYMHSEGCGCCQDRESHKLHEERLANLLNVPKYSDGSGYDFSKFRTKKEKR